MEIVRDYRDNLKGFNITYRETDLFIYADRELKKEAAKSVFKYRKTIEGYIKRFPDFLYSLKPLDVSEYDTDIILSMKQASQLANVGPFAAVAGAIAEYVAKDLEQFSQEVIVENGGDIYLTGKKDRIVKILTLNNNSIGIKIKKEKLPIAVCSSSAKIGHSYSEGKADLVTIIAKNGAVADSFATAICNKIKNIKDIDKIIEKYRKDRNILGCLIFFNGKVGGWGDINLIKIEEQ